MSCLRIRSLRDAEIDELAGAYASAQPFPHVVIPDMISAAPTNVLSNFPPLDAPCWQRLTDAYQRGKMTLSRIELIPEPLVSMLRELMEPAALEFVERISGIRSLLADPYLHGGGLFCSGPGGVMAPHTDRHMNDRLGLYRRLNLLLYLNPEWNESDGGGLELYARGDAPEPAKTIVPSWGTMVLFGSDARSVHGFARAIAPGRVRRALAIYYYTAADAPRFAGYALTHWWRHDPYWAGQGGSALFRRTRRQVYLTLRFASKTLAYLAHRTEPRASR